VEKACGSTCEDGKRDAISGKEVSRSHDTEEPENIMLCAVRSGLKPAIGSRSLIVIGVRISSRLQLKTLTDNGRRCLLRDETREVVGCVVSEPNEFGDLKCGETAKEQSDQSGEDDLGAHSTTQCHARVQHRGPDFKHHHCRARLSDVRQPLVGLASIVP